MHPQDEIIERIKQARTPVEDIAPDTPEADVEALPEEAETEESAEYVEEVVEAESEESVEEEVELSETDESEEFYLDLDGREIPLSEVREWEKGNQTIHAKPKNSQSNASSLKRSRKS